MITTINITLEDDDRLVEFEVDGSVSPYCPAKISGPPESCYPAEGGELEDITDITLTRFECAGRTLTDLTQDEIKVLKTECETHIWKTESIHENFADQANEDYWSMKEAA